MISPVFPLLLPAPADEAPPPCRVAAEESGWRLDHFLQSRFPEQSRSAFQKLIQRSSVRVNGVVALKAGLVVREGDEVAYTPPPPEQRGLVPEPVQFDILFEDEHLAAINKPPGLVVHPGPGNRSGTLAHGLLYHYRELPVTDDRRAGLAHRLDKDTSGILLVAKNAAALRALATAFEERRVDKVYQAILLRGPAADQGRIEAPIGRHKGNWLKRAVREDGRYEASNWRIVERFANGWALAEIGIETGRTHQIRVHMASLHCPVAGDALYGGAVPAGCSIAAPRQMLHAARLRFPHPATGEMMELAAPLWPDMAGILEQLRELEARS